MFSACIKYAGWRGPACAVRALRRLGLNGSGRPTLPPLMLNVPFILPILRKIKEIGFWSYLANPSLLICLNHLMEHENTLESIRGNK